MEQRPLRLGDIVDDYCPRERRITNHAIVALVEDTVKQTRCTTCDHEHVFKHAREPRRRKKDDTSALYTQVLSGLQKNGAEDEPLIESEEEGLAAEASEQVPSVETAVAETAGEAAASSDSEISEEPAAGDDAGNEIWPMHRRLIRAQLPRTGNEPPPARPLPEFTIRQPGSRGAQRWGRGNPNGGPNGNHAGRGGQGGGGQRPGRGGRFAPPRPDGPRGVPGGRPGGGRGRRSR
jgi:hypothetical protein